MIIDSPLIVVTLVVLLSLTIFIIFKMKSIPFINFKLINGGLGFCIGFLLFYIPTTIFSLDIGFKSDVTLYRSGHLFVEIVANNASIHKEPTQRSPVLRTVPKGMLLLQADIRNRGGAVWNKVLIGKGKYGWVVRITPPQLGVPKRRISQANKFYFKIGDVYNCLFGIIGFIWGFFRFRIKPA